MLLQTRGDYDFAHALTENLKNLTKAVDHLSEVSSKESEPKFQIPINGGILSAEAVSDPGDPKVRISYQKYGEPEAYSVLISLLECSNPAASHERSLYGPFSIVAENSDKS